MTRLVTTEAGIGRLDDEGGIALLQLPYPDLGVAGRAVTFAGAVTLAPLIGCGR